MSKLRKRSEIVRQFILENIEQHPKNIAAITAEKFHITRPAVRRHILNLISQGVIVSVGKTKSIKYSLHSQEVWESTISIDSKPAEDEIWRNEIKQRIGSLPDNVMQIWNHGFTEMFNNVIDHSGGHNAHITITKTALSTEILISDDGEGIFTKIKNAMSLDDERHAVIELTKGKLTTDPLHHSGEGIFFSSRMFDDFGIFSGEVFLSHIYKDDEDWILQAAERFTGTIIKMKLNNNTARTTEEIFNKFSDENYGFTKTVVPVRLAQYGNEQLVSRSQAKRLLTRIDRFKTVLFDFRGVESIGQAFADEVFRVFVNQHPEITITPLSPNNNVLATINRVKSSGNVIREKESSTVTETTSMSSIVTTSDNKKG
jgi:anti-sigma regulatory factor (Ser/Thr protein kinase)